VILKVISSMGVEMPSGIHNGCLFKKGRSHFFLADDFFLVKWMFKMISYCQLKSHVFYVLMSQSTLSLVHGYIVLHKFILMLTW